MNMKVCIVFSLAIASTLSFANDYTSIVLPTSPLNASTSTSQEKAQAGIKLNSLETHLQSSEAELKAIAQQKIEQFSLTLKKALVSAIQTGGFIHAVDVCHTSAPEIAAKLSTDGWQIARTSLKTRNDKNQPDEWEIQVLKDFDSQFKAGKEVKDLNLSLYSGKQGERHTEKYSQKQRNEHQFRYMQAIPTGQVCLACHGISVEAALSEAITKHYPNDMATGFTLEDIRGAFTLTKSAL